MLKSLDTILRTKKSQVAQGKNANVTEHTYERDWIPEKGTHREKCIVHMFSFRGDTPSGSVNVVPTEDGEFEKKEKRKWEWIEGKMLVACIRITPPTAI